MVYKKYIKRNGKLYGPYIYHSRRVNGKVISEYQGTGRKIDYKKFIFIFFGVIFILGLSYGMLSNKTRTTGNVVLETNYKEIPKLQNLEGILNISLKQGEFLPDSSKLSFETSKGNYTEYTLEYLLSDEKLNGNYYILGKNISGNGSGYGFPGEKETYPLVQFSLEIYSELGEETNGSIILGEVSADKSFTYDLQENQNAKIISSSQDINMIIEEKTLIITTDYFENEAGFGEDYIGEKEKILQVNLSKLNLAIGGNVTIALTYKNEEIISFGTLKQERNEVTKNLRNVSLADEKQIFTDTSDENQSSKIISIVGETIPLSEEEKQILVKEFGNATIESKVRLFNNRTIVRYEFGGMWIENSYDSDLNKEELEKQMQTDRIRWIRDILNQVLKEETPEKKLEGFEENYSI